MKRFIFIFQPSLVITFIRVCMAIGDSYIVSGTKKKKKVHKQIPFSLVFCFCLLSSWFSPTVSFFYQFFLFHCSSFLSLVPSFLLSLSSTTASSPPLPYYFTSFSFPWLSLSLLHLQLYYRRLFVPQLNHHYPSSSPVSTFTPLSLPSSFPSFLS